MRRKRRLPVGPGLAGVETAERLERLLGPSRAVRRGGKAEALRQKHGPRRHIACRQVVPLDQAGSHRHRVTDVGKTLAADAVRGKLAGPGGPHVHAGEIAHRVVILSVAQPAQRHRPGVAGPRGRLGIERRCDPAQQLFPLGLARLRSLLRRHVLLVQPLGDIREHLGLCEDRLCGGQARDVEIVVLGLLAVAFPAGLDQQRVNPPRIRLREVARTIGSSSGEREAHD